jgi:hypothetical protein
MEGKGGLLGDEAADQYHQLYKDDKDGNSRSLCATKCWKFCYATRKVECVDLKEMITGMTYDDMCRSISMDLIRYIDGPTTVFSSSNFALLRRSKFPIDMRKLGMLLKFGC